MTISAFRAVAHRTGAAALAATMMALTGCVATVPTAADKPGPAATVAPASGFAAALRCMDVLLLDHGARDLSVMVEPLADPAQRQAAGTRELLMTALSDMTQRSRAIRVVAADPVSTGTPKRDIHALAPQYVLRGSIRQIEGAPLLRADSGAAAGATSVIGIDLALLNSQDMSLVPGTSTLNVLTARRGSAGALQVQLRKFGVAFDPTWSGPDAPTAARRALAELASIELVGRLTKVPYWTCLGASDADEAVQAEIRDWYDTMAARPAEIIQYFQLQLRQRRAYDGALDGTVNPAFKDAVARYREAMGQAREAKLSLEFFQAYLSADHRQVAARLAPAAPAAPAAQAYAVAPPARPQATTVPARAPLNLQIATVNEAKRFARGEAVQLTIRPSRDAHVYCFLQDEKRQVTRFFPNRWQRDSRVQPDTGLQLPGAMRFEIVMNPRGVQEMVTCFATETDVLPALPSNLNAADFHPLPVASIDQLRTAFARAAGGGVAQDSFEIRAK